MPDTGSEGEAADPSRLDRVLWGEDAGKRRRKREGRDRDLLTTVGVPVLVALVTLGGVALGSWWTSDDNDASIAAERDRIFDQFRLDQQQVHYAEIRQQATRLENAGDFSTAAAAAGSSFLSKLGIAGGLAGAAPPTALDEADALKKLNDAALMNVAGQNLYSKLYGDTYGVRPSSGNSWQDAYTALDQAISNAEIASSDEVISIARALRDKYRDDYYRSILANIDSVIATYPDPKPDKEKLADALVGVPAEPRTYDEAWRTKSTDELTAMYVEAAKEDLELNDR